MTEGITFDRRSGERIAAAVRRVEAMPASMPRQQRGTVHTPSSPPWMVKAQEAMVADDTAYNVKYLEADGTEGTQIAVRRANGVAVASGDVGLLAQDSSGQWVFFFRPAVDTSVVYQPANTRMVDEVGATDAIIRRQEYNGSWADTEDHFLLWKLDATITVGAAYDLNVWINQTSGIHNYKTTCYSDLGGGTCSNLEWRWRLAVLKEDFTLATLDRAGLEALSQDIHYFRMQNAPATGSCGGEFKESGGSLFSQSFDAESVTVYGFALYAEDVHDFTGSPVNTDTRSVNTTFTSSNYALYFQLIPEASQSR